MIDRKKYPEILFNLSKNYITQLQSDCIIDNKYNITIDIALQKIHNNAFAKLLYSILWKNGDLGKEYNLIKGVISKNINLPDSGIVFYQFGKYLADHNEPIIDQHVIRCFLIRKEDDLNLVRKYVSLEVVDNSCNKSIQEYKEWVKKVVIKGKYCTGDIDEILFAFGRYIKKEKRRKLTIAST